MMPNHKCIIGVLTVFFCSFVGFCIGNLSLCYNVMEGCNWCPYFYFFFMLQTHLFFMIFSTFVRHSYYMNWWPKTKTLQRPSPLQTKTCSHECTIIRDRGTTQILPTLPYTAFVAYCVFHAFLYISHTTRPHWHQWSGTWILPTE